MSTKTPSVSSKEPSSKEPTNKYPTASPTVTPTTGEPTTGEPSANPTASSSVNCEMGTLDTCKLLGCLWNKKKCNARSMLSNTKKKTYFAVRCNWDMKAADKCHSCNTGGNDADCQASSCVWNKFQDVQMCMPCIAIAAKGECKKVGCAWKNGCKLCVTMKNKKKCDKAKSYTWNGSSCHMPVDGR